MIPPALILPVLLFALSGPWAGIGPSSFQLSTQTPFEGAVSFRGAQISNAVASISLIGAWCTLIISILLQKRSLLILVLGALVIPFIHSCGFVVDYYNQTFRNTANHIAFMAVIIALAMCLLEDFLRIHPDEETEI